jgi:hypothetical protein
MARRSYRKVTEGTEGRGIARERRAALCPDQSGMGSNTQIEQQKLTEKVILKMSTGMAISTSFYISELRKPVLNVATQRLP